MDGIFRRKSGVYFARLVVPARLRPRLGRRELIASLRVREVQQAQIVGATVLSAWRRLLRELDDRPPVDLVQLSLGSPLLAGEGLVRLDVAAQASGMDEAELLDLAAAGRLNLYVVPGPGFLVPLGDLDRDAETGGYDVPLPRHMPPSAQRMEQPGAMAVDRQDHSAAANALLGRDQECTLVLLDVPGRVGVGFAPDDGVRLTAASVRFSAAQVEELRQQFAAKITKEQLEAAKATRRSGPSGSASGKRVSEAIEAFMHERERSCSPDQARRIRAACGLFAELAGNPRLQDITRATLRHYRDTLLPCVPAHENKIRLREGTTCVTQSMEAVKGTDWPRISEEERAKRMQWLCAMFAWLAREKWLPEDPAEGLAGAPTSSRKKARHARRDLFRPEDLQKIFGAPWFQTGRGELTRAGTYREFLPYYYWLPLLGLYTGARINELCQLALSDIRHTAAGTAYIDVNEHDDAGKKKVKNAQSHRQIPLHQQIVACGLIEWRDALAQAGHTRLFPELSHDPAKGYSKAAVKWFSSYLRRLGWPRDGKLVFHSFRHTLASYCLNTLRLSETVTAQISGHQRSTSVLGSTYRKEVQPDELLPVVNGLAFDLPPMAPFDVEAGLVALGDALRRKRT